MASTQPVLIFKPVGPVDNLTTNTEASKQAMQDIMKKHERIWTYTDL